MVLGVSPGEYRRHGAFADYVAVPRGAAWFDRLYRKERGLMKVILKP